MVQIMQYKKCHDHGCKVSIGCKDTFLGFIDSTIWKKEAAARGQKPVKYDNMHGDWMCARTGMARVSVACRFIPTLFLLHLPAAITDGDGLSSAYKEKRYNTVYLYEHV
jgi:hypothetical protein